MREVKMHIKEGRRSVLTVQIPTIYCQERSPKQTVFDSNHGLYIFFVILSWRHVT